MNISKSHKNERNQKHLLKSIRSCISKVFSGSQLQNFLSYNIGSNLFHQLKTGNYMKGLVQFRTYLLNYNHISFLLARLWRSSDSRQTAPITITSLFNERLIFLTLGQKWLHESVINDYENSIGHRKAFYYERLTGKSNGYRAHYFIHLCILQR